MSTETDVEKALEKMRAELNRKDVRLGFDLGICHAMIILDHETTSPCPTCEYGENDGMDGSCSNKEHCRYNKNLPDLYKIRWGKKNK